MCHSVICTLICILNYLVINPYHLSTSFLDFSTLPTAAFTPVSVDRCNKAATTGCVIIQLSGNKGGAKSKGSSLLMSMSETTRIIKSFSLSVSLVCGQSVTLFSDQLYLLVQSSPLYHRWPSWMMSARRLRPSGFLSSQHFGVKWRFMCFGPQCVTLTEDYVPPLVNHPHNKPPKLEQ